MQALHNKRIVVTGGAGFIGSNLIEALLALGNEVLCLDNLLTGFKANIARFLNNPRFTFVEGDIRDMAICEEVVKGAHIVYHEAALGSVPRSIENPIPTAEINIMGFVNMLTAAKNAGVERFIYASSSSTYGDADYSPKVETRKGHLLSPYAVTKQANDLFAEVFSRTYGIKTIGLCYFNVFGPYQNPEGVYAAVIPKFIALLREHKAPQIYGDGKQSRDFTYVENVVNANILAATAEFDALHEHINIACGDSIDLTTLTQYMIEKLSEFDPEIAAIQPHYTAVRKGDILHSCASIDKARKLLGYAPKITVKEGIDRTIQWTMLHR
ncbi:MAG: SDR family oxidoreductase [Bacteroidales bacterium]|jgi:UDP-N-acetylglucosamine 4-epimerase|nr:SDR family oxidoreductase [Bacteroidales bacterium]